MAIVGAAVVPAIQGYIADMFHSLQLSFPVSMLCFVYVGVYFWRESKVRTALAGSHSVLRRTVMSTRINLWRALLARNLVSCWKIVILLSRLFDMTAVSRGLKLQTVVDI